MSRRSRVRKKEKAECFKLSSQICFHNPPLRNPNRNGHENIQTSLPFSFIAGALNLLVAEKSDPEAESPLICMVSERLRLSYVDQDRCIKLLKLYGVRVGTPDRAVDPKDLPVVVPTPVTAFHDVIPDHEKVFPQTETDPINELLLFYDPQKPESAGSIRRIIAEQIDLPARKIMIEAMVLEISSQALDQLGVEWDFNSGKDGVSSGNFINRKLDGPNDSLVVGKILSPTVGTPHVPPSPMSFEFNLRLQALAERFRSNSFPSECPYFG